MRVKVLVSLLAILAILAGAAATPVLAQTTPTQGDIDSRLEAAKADRAFSANRLDQARQRHELAEHARNNAREADNAQVRNGWNRTARDHQQKATELEQEAARLIRSAERKEARAKELQEILTAAEEVEQRRQALRDLQAETSETPAPDGAAPRLQVQHITGIWRDTKDQQPFIITPSDPDIPAWSYRLEAQTMERVWQGTYSAFAEGDIRRVQDSLLRFSLKPTAEEINPEIPLWAREQVEGKLEWVIELDESGSCGSPKLKGQWYPGEVSWRDGDGNEPASAWISGKGDPVPLELASSGDLFFESVERSLVRLRIPGQPDPRFRPAEALIKGQEFYVEVLLPPDMAEKQGPSLQAVLTGKQGNDSYELDLEAAPTPSKRSVVYSHGSPIVIGDAIDRLILGGRDANPLSLDPGSVIDLSVVNGEVVSVTFGAALQSVSVYDTPLLRSIARQEDALEWLRRIFADFVSNESLKSKARENAQRRLQMVKNAKELVGLSSKLTPAQRYAAGVAYIGPDGMGGMIMAPLGPDYEYFTGDNLGQELATARFSWYDETTVAERPSYRHSPHVIWMSRFEEVTATQAIAKAKPDKGALFEELNRVMAFAIYEYIATTTPAGNLTVFVFGHDHHGKRKSFSDRLKALVELAVIDVGMPLASHRLAQAFRSSERRAIRFGKRSRKKSALHVGRKGPLPRGLDDAALRARLRKAVGHATDLEPVGCPPRAGPGEGAKVPDFTPPPPLPEALPDITVNPPPLKPVIEPPATAADFGPKVRVVDPSGKPSHHKQDYQNCNCQAALWLHEQATGEHIDQGDAVFLMKAMDIGFPKRDALEKGFDNQDAGDLVNALGGRSLGSHDMTLEQMDATMRAGFGVKNVLDLLGPGRNRGEQRHAVGLKELKRNAKGDIETVVFFDPASGHVLELPACDYRKLLTTPDQHANTQLFFWN